MVNIHMLNLISVGLFGMVLSAAFCDIHWTKYKALGMAVSMAGMFLLQGVVYFGINPDIVEYIYPIITHLPLTVTLCILNKKCLWPTLSVLTAYLCCQIRRWQALLAVTLLSGDSDMQNMVELVMTLPILLILLKFIAPSVRSLSRYSKTVQIQFGLVPALYYGFDYMTKIYEEWPHGRALVVVEFMPFVCSVAYLVFVVHESSEGRTRSRLEQTQEILNLQVTQAIREIESMRESQQKTKAYRHDLRHHLQYLSTCMQNGRIEKAQEYIRGICSEMEAVQMKNYCENEAANLIFSFFAARAEESGILIRIGAGIPEHIAVAENDLCVLLSNALENALHACQKRKERGLSEGIEVSAYEKNDKLYLQFANPCDGDIAFCAGIPVTNNPGHGVGVRSICAIVERYNGIYSFAVKGGQFILRVVL